MKSEGQNPFSTSHVDQSKKISLEAVSQKVRLDRHLIGVISVHMRSFRLLLVFIYTSDTPTVCALFHVLFSRVVSLCAVARCAPLFRSPQSFHCASLFQCQIFTNLIVKKADFFTRVALTRCRTCQLDKLRHILLLYLYTNNY